LGYSNANHELTVTGNAGRYGVGINAEDGDAVQGRILGETALKFSTSKATVSIKNGGNIRVRQDMQVHHHDLTELTCGIPPDSPGYIYS
jgi:hypothetical protein